MLSSTVLSVFFVLAIVVPATIAFPPIQFDTFNTSTQVEIVTFDDIDGILRISELTPLSARSNGIPLRFTFGSRDPSGDSIVSQGSGFKSSSSPQTVKLNLNYPFFGQGALITFVEINLEQSSRDAKANIVSGGIKERNIRIKVDSKNTDRFKYSFKIYGKY